MPRVRALRWRHEVHIQGALPLASAGDGQQEDAGRHPLAAAAGGDSRPGAVRCGVSGPAGVATRDALCMLGVLHGMLSKSPPQWRCRRWRCSGDVPVCILEIFFLCAAAGDLSRMLPFEAHLMVAGRRKVGLEFEILQPA